MVRTVQNLAIARNAAYTRRLDVSRLLLEGRTHASIAVEVGVSAATITGDVKAIRGWWRERAGTDYDIMVHEELARLDALLGSVMPRAISGSLQALDRVLAIVDRRIRLLGLEAPKHRIVEADYVVRQYVGIDPANFDQEALEPLSDLSTDEIDQDSEEFDDLSA